MGAGTDPKATGKALGRYTGALTPGQGRGRRGVHTHAHTIRCICAHHTHTHTRVHTLATRLRGQRVTTASKPVGTRASRGEGAATSRSLSSWYRAVSSSSCRCFLTTSLLEAAPRVVPMHLYRKFCNEVREQGCAWLPSRGVPSTTKALPPAEYALSTQSTPLAEPADAGTHGTDRRKDQTSSGRCLRSRRWVRSPCISQPSATTRRLPGLPVQPLPGPQGPPETGAGSE